MTHLNRKDVIKTQITRRSRILALLLSGVVFLLVPILMKIFDPIQMIVNYKLRLAKGTILYNILQHEIPAARIAVYVFNITNAERFISGEDYNLKVEEIGPFVFQEYRWYLDLEMSEDGKSMGMTPRMRSEFVPEASIDHPKDVNLTLPNVPFLSVVTILSNYPRFLQYAFNIMAAQIGQSAFLNIDVHSFLWGYKNPLVTLSKNLAPGLVYFENLGLLDRLYENESDYRIVVGATNQDRFKIKSVKKVRLIKSEDIDHVDVSEITFKEDTYEGGAYPPMLSPEAPLNLFRLGICRTVHLEYIGSRIMEEYGGEALVYTISNSTFLNNVNPITLKTYPDGLMDIAECYYGLPFVLSKTRFLDSDTKLLDRIDGQPPDRKEHINEIVIDRKASIMFNAKMAIQVSMMLDDMSSNTGTKMMSNSVIPIAHVKLELPKMTEGTMSKFVLVYTIAPYVVICIEAVSALIGLVFVGHAMRLVHSNWTSRTTGMVFQTTDNKKLKNAEMPLIEAVQFTVEK